MADYYSRRLFLGMAGGALITASCSSSRGRAPQDLTHPESLEALYTELLSSDDPESMLEQLAGSPTSSGEFWAPWDISTDLSGAWTLAILMNDFIDCAEDTDLTAQWLYICFNNCEEVSLAIKPLGAEFDANSNVISSAILNDSRGNDIYWFTQAGRPLSDILKDVIEDFNNRTANTADNVNTFECRLVNPLESPMIDAANLTP